MSFTFSTTPRILSALGGSSRAGAILKGLGCKNVALVTDKGVRGAGLLAAATASLDAEGVGYFVFDEVLADPPLDVVLDAVAKGKQHQIDGVLGIGGGSPLDVAKLVAFLNGDTEQKIENDEIWGVDMCQGKRLPLVQVPTTAGTGSEVTPIAIITTGAGEKKGVVSQQLYPDCAIADGDLTLSVPPLVTAATGIDAMVHCFEAYTSKLRKNPLSDLLAKEGLSLLGSNIRAVVADGANAEARGAMLLGSMYGGMAFANAPVAAVHALAYPVGANFKVPHGLSCCLMLPHVVRFNSTVPAAETLYSEMLPYAFPELAGGAAFLSGSELFAQGFEALANDFGIETRLSQVGIAESDIPTLAAQAMLQTRLLPNNQREMTEQDAVELYHQCL